MKDSMRTTAERQSWRDFYIQRENHHGMQKALRMERTLVCQEKQHSKCKNTGENCLCFCHDPN